MANSGKVSGRVELLSGLSAWSLMAFGVLSLLITLFSWSWAGALIGAALLAHGVVELRLRARFLPTADRSAGNGLAWNQLGLAGSVLIYLSWQLATFDRSELDAMLSRDPIHSLLQQAPSEVSDLFYSDFPKLLAGAYGSAGLLVLIGCLGMALMYRRSRQN